jgi:hypothetical protein
MAKVSELSAKLRSSLNVASVVLSLIPLILIIFYIAQNGVNVPQDDEWDASYPIVVKTLEGSLTLKDLTAQHNEHRLLFANLATVFLTLTTDWNVKAGMYLNVALATINLVLIASLFYHDEPKNVLYVMVPVAWLIFSFRQNFNWLIALQSTWYFSVVCASLVLWLIVWRPINWWPVILGAVFTALNIFSMTTGFVMLVVTPLALFLRGYRNKWYFIFWLAFSAAITGLFFTGYKFSNAVYAGFQPLNLITYASMYLANPLLAPATFSITEAKYLSFLLICIGACSFLLNFAYLWLSPDSEHKSFTWLALACFAVGVALLTGLGRLQLFVAAQDQPLSSRYVVFSSLFWVAVIAQMALAQAQLYRSGRRPPWKKLLAYSNLSVFIILTVLYCRANYADTKAPVRITEEAKECVVNYPVTQDETCLGGVYPLDVSRITGRIDELERYQVSSFADVTPEPPR